MPVDESQTHCALSGERFQQSWEEQHQEWRYKDAKRLDADEAARCAGSVYCTLSLGIPALACKPGSSEEVLLSWKAAVGMCVLFDCSKIWTCPKVSSRCSSLQRHQ